MSEIPEDGWLPVFRRAADAVQAAIAGVWGSEAGRAPLGAGAGGDTTVAVDGLAEAAAVAVLEEAHRAGRGFDLLSEELGERRYGGGGDLVVVDPIDGSVNAMMGVPFFSVAFAAAGGRTYGEVREGAVRNLVTGEHFEARRGAGAWRNGRPIQPIAALRDGRLRVLQVEPTRLNRDYDGYRPLVARAEKVRMLGSAALNLVYTATGALSATVAASLRSVDCAGAILVVEEAGGAVATLEGEPVGGMDLGLSNRISLAASASPEALRLVLGLLREGAGPDA